MTPGTSLAIRDDKHWLEVVAETQKLAERCETVEAAQELAAKARMLEVWARRVELSEQHANLAVAARLWAERRTGELLAQTVGHTVGPGRGKKNESQPAIRLPVGVTRSQSSRWQKLAKIPKSKFGKLLNELVPEGRVTYAEVERRSKRADREKEAAAEEKRLRETARTNGLKVKVKHSAIADFDPGEVTAIVTDPPYITDDALDLYAALGDLAADVLCVGGALVAMTWQPILPDVLAILSKRLVYRWTVAWVSGAHESTADHARRVFDRWKPVVVFHSGGWDDDAGMLTDVVMSGRDEAKTLHPWQQDVAGFRQLIRAVSEPGDLICDPFLGSGTTGLAAAAEDRNFIGADIDKATIATARERLSA